MSLRTIVPVALACLGAALPSSATAQGERPRFVIIGFGDSYAAGEGDPEVAGNYAIDGQVGTAEVWTQTTDNVAFDDAWRCHRSPNSGLGRATRTLQQRYPGIEFILASFACSGAQIDSGVLGVYDGIDNHFAGHPALPSQVDQAVAFLATQPTRQVDAIVVNIGGNDAGFGMTIFDCLFAPNLPMPQVSPTAPVVLKGCESNSATLTRLRAGLADLRGPQGLFAQMNTAFTDRLAPARVYVTEVPNPARGSDGQLCHLSGPGVFATATRDEARFIEASVVNGLNTTFRNAATAAGPTWKLVTGIAAAYRTHGICAADSWFRNAADAMVIQGPEIVAGYATALDGRRIELGLLSAGFLHPNAGGYQAIADNIVRDLDAQVQARFTVAVAPRLSVDTVVAPSTGVVRTARPISPDRRGVAGSAGGGSITFAWTNPAPDATTRFVLTIDGRDIDVPAGTTGYVLRESGRVQARVRACGVLACGPQSNLVVASNIPPGTPTALRKVATPGTVQWAGVIPLAWTAADAEQEYFQVQYRSLSAPTATAVTAGVTSRSAGAVAMPGMTRGSLLQRTTQPTWSLGSAQQPLPSGAQYEIQVRACNSAGCSEFTPAIVATPGAAAAPAPTSAPTATAPKPTTTAKPATTIPTRTTAPAIRAPRR